MLPVRTDRPVTLATTPADALDVLEPSPPELEGDHPSGAVWYAPRPERFEDGLLLSVLAARGLRLDEAAAAWIAAQNDPGVLDECIRKAATATTAAEVLKPTRKSRSGGSRGKAAPRARSSNGHKKVHGQPR